MSNSQIQGSGLMTEILKGLSKAKEVVIFSGAGLSADSGIPTFRDGASGLWANVDPMEVASIDGLLATYLKAMDRQSCLKNTSPAWMDSAQRIIKSLVDSYGMIQGSKPVNQPLDDGYPF